MLLESQVQPEQGYAGEYLKTYEWERYTLAERLPRFLDWVPSLIVPVDAEQFADVSFYQQGMNWDIYATKARVAIIRIGQGAWKDTSFEFFYSEARRVGVALGGYWFYDDRYSPEQQTAIIIAAMQGKYFEKEIYIDWETVYGGAYQGLKNVVKLMKLLAAAGLQVYGVGMYTGYYFFREHSNETDNAAEYAYLSTTPLWLAWYAAASVVKTPVPWYESTWIDWQWGTPTWSWGQPTAEIDMNRSRYTTTEFENRYLGGSTTPPGGGDMEITHVGTVVTPSLKVRTGPGTQYPEVDYSLIGGGLREGDKVFGRWDYPGTGWFNFSQIERANNGPVQMFTAWASAVNGDRISPPPPYIRVEPYTEPPPPPTGKAQIEIVYDPAAVEITLTPQ